MFIDTKVLINSRIAQAPHHEIARDCLSRSMINEPLRISRQVVREYLSVVTRPQPWSVAITLEDALDDAGRLTRSFEILEDGPVVTETLVALCRAMPMGGKQVHDANIVATMSAHGTRRLPTFNTAELSPPWRPYRTRGDSVELVTIAEGKA